MAACGGGGGAGGAIGRGGGGGGGGSAGWGRGGGGGGGGRPGERWAGAAVTGQAEPTRTRVGGPGHRHYLSCAPPDLPHETGAVCRSSLEVGVRSTVNGWTEQ